MGSVAARTPASSVRQSFVRAGGYAAMSVSGLAIFFIEGGRAFFLPIISAAWLGLAVWFLIPAVARYRRERAGRNAASQP